MTSYCFRYVLEMKKFYLGKQRFLPIDNSDIPRSVCRSVQQERKPLLQVSSFERDFQFSSIELLGGKEISKIRGLYSNLC